MNLQQTSESSCHPMHLCNVFCSVSLSLSYTLQQEVLRGLHRPVWRDRSLTHLLTVHDWRRLSAGVYRQRVPDDGESSMLQCVSVCHRELCQWAQKQYTSLIDHRTDREQEQRICILHVSVSNSTWVQISAVADRQRQPFSNYHHSREIIGHRRQK